MQLCHCLCVLLNVEKTSRRETHAGWVSQGSPSYLRAKSRGMEDESAVSSRYSVEPSLSNPRSGTSSMSESKSAEDRELFPLRTINLWGTKMPDSKLEKRGRCRDCCLNRDTFMCIYSRLKVTSIMSVLTNTTLVYILAIFLYKMWNQDFFSSFVLLKWKFLV